jgi:hypothetical protein
MGRSQLKLMTTQHEAAEETLATRCIVINFTSLAVDITGDTESPDMGGTEAKPVGHRN